MQPTTRILAIAALLVAAAAPLRAAVIYVSPTGTGDGSAPGTPAGLQAALTAAAANGEEDDLRLAAGTYSAAAATFTYDVTGDAATGDTGFYAVGGWNADFTEQADDPALTVLDGGGARRILFVDARRVGRAPDIGFQAIRFTGGLATDGSTNGHGGAIYGEPWVAKDQHGTIELSLYNCVFDQNTAPGGGYGGAIFLTGALYAGGVDFIGNAAGSAGAVSVHVYDWYYADNVHRHDHTIPASFEHCEFRDNVSTTDAGPVVMRVLGNALTLESVKVHNTTGTAAGRTQTIAAYESTVKMNACEFRNNRTDWWASAIDLLGSPAVITNSLFENNWAGVTGHNGIEGGGLFAGWDYEISGHPSSPDPLTVINCTFINNKGFNTDYSLLNLQWPQTAVFSNCIFKGNEQPAILGTATARYSRLDGTPGADGFTDGGGNTTAQPSFQVADTDYKLNWDSPLIDLGDNGVVPDWMDWDFKGAVRVFAINNRELPKVDMGWDEYIDWTLNFTAPAAGTFWLNDGTPKTIAWYCNNIGGNVDLTLWKGPDEEHAVKVADINPGPVRCDAQGFSWTIPADLADGEDYAVVISPAFYTTIDRAAAPLAIQHLRLTAPNGGQSLVQGSTYKIAWQSGNLPGALIRAGLYSGRTLKQTIAKAAPNTGSFLWKVPFTQQPGAEYFIRISTAAPHAAADWSDRAFKVLPAVTLTAPNGGQSIKRGTKYAISWTYRNNPGSTVQLDLYKAGVFNRTIVPAAPIGTAGKGSFLWTVAPTQTPAATYTVVVRSTANPRTCFDASNSAFRITK